MRTIAVLAAALALSGCSALTPRADPASDAPEGPRPPAAAAYEAPASWRDALAGWHRAEDVNAWIAARFQYDTARAMLLSETQRQRNGRMPIPAPEQFFAEPHGVCVDLARFAVETLSAVEPASKPAYLMIEFDPVSISGNVLRRHWVVAFERDGRHYVFADSKRPGHIAGPYASTDEFIAAYAAFRGRTIVAYREVDTYQRRLRTLADKRVAEPRP